MKKRTKKFCLIAAGVLSSVALGLACASCQDPVPSIILEDFEDTEITVALDDMYTLPIGNAVDTNGNDYRVTFAVTTEAGKTVNPFNNSFTLKYYEDYYIFCTADLGGEVRTRTITLKVQDAGAPVITFGKIKRGIVNREYTLPETFVEDSSKENLTANLKVFELNGEEKGEEIPTVDGKFTPGQTGYYLIEATATDSNGNVGVESAKMYVRSSPQANEIVSFQYAEDIECVGWSQTNGSITWLEEFEGETGVAKFSYTGGYWANSFAVLPLQSVAEDSALYDTYDTLIVRMYIKNDAEFTNYFAANGAAQMIINKNVAGSDKEVEKAYHTKTNLAYNQWVDFAFDINALSAWDNEELNVYSDKLWGYGVKKLDGEGVEIMHKGEFYVAGIFCANQADVTVAASSYTVGSTVSFSTDATASNVRYTLVKPDGTKQALSGNTYVIDQKGTYTVNLVADGVYGEARFTATRALDSEKEFLSFNHAEDINHVAVNATRGTVTLLDSYQNETGVLKLDWNGNKWPTVAIAPMQDKTAYANYEYVVFRVWVSSETTISSFKLQSTENGSKKDYSTSTAVVHDQWVDYKFDISALANWTDSGTASELLVANCTFYGTFSSATQGTIYIADVSFA